MFCSKCGEEQASESRRFCSRCGLKLSPIEDGLAKRLMALAMYLVIAICAIFGWGSITAGPGYVQIRILVTIIAAITVYMLFANDLTETFNRLVSRSTAKKKQIAPASDDFVLPSRHSFSEPSLGWHRVNTAEMVPPTSVTEQTTNLLDKNKH